MAVPIWKDYIVTLNATTSARFRIVTGGTTVYEGRAFAKPYASNIPLRINDICADFLQNTFPIATASLQVPTFSVQEYIGGTWSSVASVQFFNDWSYDYDYSATSMGMAFPINGRADRRQQIYFSSAVSGTIYVMRNGGALRSASYSANSTVVISAANGDAVYVSDSIGYRKIYDIAQTCSRYVLYYANAYGGWDSLLIDGNEVTSDAYARMNRAQGYDNRQAISRGEENFVTQIERTFKMHTGFLTDAESERVHHLLGSTSVYLHDLETGETLPVLITNQAVEFQTYKNRGNRFPQYVIDVKLAQVRMRR